MATPYFIPLGFIDRLEGDSAIFTLTDPKDVESVAPGTPVTVWHYSRQHSAVARTRGAITNLGQLKATFKAVDVDLGAEWPPEEVAMQPGLPVYLALPDSFEPDLSRLSSRDEAESLARRAADYDKWETEMADDAPVPEDPGGTC